MGDVDAHDRAAGTDTLGQFKRGLPTATADIEHLLPWFDTGPLHGDETKGINLRVKLLLSPHPARPSFLVPIAQLFVVSLCLWHGSSLFFQRLSGVLHVTKIPKRIAS